MRVNRSNINQASHLQGKWIGYILVVTLSNCTQIRRCLWYVVFMYRNTMFVVNDGLIKWKFEFTGPLRGEFTGHRRIPLIKGQWCGALIFSSICAWINSWVNNREAGDLRHHRAHYDVIVMQHSFSADGGAMSQVTSPMSHWLPRQPPTVYTMIVTQCFCTLLIISYFWQK